MKLTSEELREIYARGTSAGPGPHPEADTLSRLLRDDVSAGERDLVVRHVAACSRCAEDLRVARAVGDELSKDDAPVVRPSSWFRPAVLLAAAAAVLVAGGLALRTATRPPSSEPTYRAPDTPGLRSLLPPGAPVARAAPLLRWSGAPAGVTFEVVLANERLDVLARFPVVREPQLVIPASVLSALPSRSKLVWKVTVVQPDGSRSDAATFVNPVE